MATMACLLQLSCRHGVLVAVVVNVEAMMTSRHFDGVRIGVIVRAHCVRCIDRQPVHNKQSAGHRYIEYLNKPVVRNRSGADSDFGHAMLNFVRFFFRIKITK